VTNDEGKDMKEFIRILRMTVVGGALFLAPFIVLIIILGKAIQLLRLVTVPVAEHIPIESALGLETPRFLAIVLLLAVCFLAGLFAQTKIAKRLVHWLESTLLSNLPGYSFMKNLGEEAAGTAPAQRQKAVIVQFDDAWQIGFIVERIEGEKVVVFIPDAPSPWTGGVFIFDENRVKTLEVPSTVAIKSLQRLGEGTGALVKGNL
jgi:uncharacterized membrane protein